MDSCSKELFALNYDCFQEIIASLSNVDLLNMCLASDRLKETILNCDLRKRIFDFKEFASCHILPAFKIFGQRMVNLKISERDIRYQLDGLSKFDEILRLIAAHCSLDTIKHLNIQYYHTSQLKKRFIYNAVPFFRQIESFAISETDGRGTETCVDYFIVSRNFNKSINDFVERVLIKAVSVKSIELYWVKVTGRFLHLPLSNLKTLQFVGCNVRDSLGIFSFLNTKPNLTKFSWIHSSVRGLDNLLLYSSDSILETVSNNLTNLETFEYSQNEMYIGKSNKIKMHTIYTPVNLLLINNFQKLENLAIRPITSELWRILEKKGTLKKISWYPYRLYDHKAVDYDPSYAYGYEDFRQVKFDS